MRRDLLVSETLRAFVLGKATADDVRTVIESALAQPGWEGHAAEQKELTHLLTCSTCMVARMTEVRQSPDVMVQLIAEEGFDTRVVPAYVTKH